MEQWQNRMLPVMVAILIGAAILFATATVVQYARMAAWMTAPAPPPAATMWADPALSPASFAERMTLAQRRAEYALEGDVIRRRYEQANQAIATRLWARFMGFLTGMIMAIVGSAFVLGKLSEPGTEITGSGAGTALSIKSASPGIVLATLGTVLIGMSLTVQVSVNTVDVPTYFAGSVGRGDPALLDDIPAPGAAAAAPVATDAKQSDAAVAAMTPASE